MVRMVETSTFLQKSQKTPIIDVRSPGEYELGHIPGAINIPIFNDEERKIIGTLYKKSGRDAAVFKGLDIVGPKMKKIVTEGKLITKDGELCVHCWRGGMRSQNMAMLFSTMNLKSYVLKDGYKAYRGYIRKRLGDNANIIILSGMTGSGKSELLAGIYKTGEQIIDLEGLSNHKGSAFGALGQLPQPGNEQFENNLYAIWDNLDLNKRIWIEDESHSVGSIFIPEPLYAQMRNTRVIRINLSKEIRIKRLVREYASFDNELLEQSIQKIHKRLGGQHAKKAIEALQTNDYETVTDIVLTYYDKAYLHGLSKRKPHFIHEISLDSDNHKDNVETVINFAKSLENE